MPTNPDLYSPEEYPDVLGTITGGSRLNVDMVQCAFTVYPNATALGQPFEALVLLQNMCDKPIQVQINLQIPRKDSLGNRMSLIAAKDEIVVNMQPGETGLLHVPIVPHLPTQPTQNNTMSVRIQPRVPKAYKLVRHADGGRPATALNMSLLRLNILREVSFMAVSQVAGVLTAPFNIIPGQVQTMAPAANRYETLWSVKELPNEQARYAASVKDAERFAATLSRSTVMEPLLAITEQRFAQAGLPLHPGETLFAVKTLTYIMEDGLDLETGFGLVNGRWFNRLVSVVSDQYMTQDEDRLCSFLYTAVVYDAVRVGLNIVERYARQKFGTQDEHAAYAEAVVGVLEGRNQVDLGHVYLPLVLTGIVLNLTIKSSKENLWDSLASLKEAWTGRVRLADSTIEPISQILTAFIKDAELTLTRSRVPRPDGK
ncbi:MAG: hypothetical protein ABI947_17365 [Chloroflexota bacterium]